MVTYCMPRWTHDVFGRDILAGFNDVFRILSAAESYEKDRLGLTVKFINLATASFLNRRELDFTGLRGADDLNLLDIYDPNNLFVAEHVLSFFVWLDELLLELLFR